MRVIYSRESAPEELARLLDKPLLQDNPSVEESVRSILSDVRDHGDAAVFQYVRKFDWPQSDSLVVSESDVDAAYDQVSQSLLSAIRTSRDNIAAFHEKQIRNSWMDCDDMGRLLGQLIRPMDRVGVLVPGFQVASPEFRAHGAVPAKVAGVREIYLSTPPRSDGSIHPAIAVAAREAGIDRIFRIGGAHGVAALAYGTETVPRVDKIVGPGNVYVAMAKRFVYGQVGIDMLAGPSEVIVLADETAEPAFVAADLLSQAEHDQDARALLITVSGELAERVSAEVEKQLAVLARADTARRSIEENGAIIVAQDMAEALVMVNRAAPEHLEVMTADPLLLLGEIRHAGAIFLGRHTTESLGDYLAGPNHTLPTSGTARFSSPLNLDDYTKKSSVLMYSERAMLSDARATMDFAEAEGLTAHANSVRLRVEKASERNR